MCPCLHCWHIHALSETERERRDFFLIPKVNKYYCGRAFVFEMWSTVCLSVGRLVGVAGVASSAASAACYLTHSPHYGLDLFDIILFKQRPVYHLDDMAVHSLKFCERSGKQKKKIFLDD